MLSYRCTNACRHCLYWCSPKQPDEWMTEEMARKVFGALQKEPRLQSIHFAGGEATLRPDLLEKLISMAAEMEIPIAYLETNAYWCTDAVKTRDQLERWRSAGLPALLVSVSMFHNEFVPFKNSMTCIESACQVFGAGNVIIYLPHMVNLLSQLPGDGKHSLSEFCEHFGLREQSPDIPRLYQVIPSGRAAEALRDCYRANPASAYLYETCDSELLSTSHFHVDRYGNLFTGLCAGIASATVYNLHPTISPESHPVFVTLCTEGPCGLTDLATKTCGYEERESGYVSKCDLCMDVRRRLYRTGRFTELRPACLYQT